MPNHYDLIVIGGGALGAFQAYHALRRGLKVLLIERDQTPSSATVRNFGQVVPSGQEASRWEHGRRGLEVYRELQAQTDITVRENGSTYLASDAGEWQLLLEAHQFYAEQGYSSTLLDRTACLACFDRLRADYCVGGLHFAQELTVEPRLLIGRVLEYMVRALGLHYLPNTLAVACHVRADACQTTTAAGATFHSGQVAVCTGGEFRALFPDLFAQSGMQLCKLQMMRTVPLPHLRLPGAILTGRSIRRYEAFHALPSYAQVAATDPQPELARWGIHLLFKQGTDGSIIIGDSHEYAPVGQTESLDFGLSQYLNQLMLTEAQRIFALPTWQMESQWAGYYATHPSGLYEHTIDGRIHLSTGIGGKGMSIAAGYAAARIEQIFG
jgi:FAD dependent oxidoreductase TIGR03364